MFLRWVKIIKIKKINNNNLRLLSFTWLIFKASETFSLKVVTTKIVREENIDDKDENLKMRETTTQVNINKIASGSDKANNIPKYVATPFPPLNFSQTGKMWPKKTNKADSCVNSGKNFRVKIIGIYPLRTSNNNVVKAKYLFPVLRTFVAPMFPEPTFLISWLEKSLVMMSPKGTEPLIYENKKTIM